MKKWESVCVSLFVSGFTVIKRCHLASDGLLSPRLVVIAGTAAAGLGAAGLLGHDDLVYLQHRDGGLGR